MEVMWLRSQNGRHASQGVRAGASNYTLFGHDRSDAQTIGTDMRADRGGGFTNDDGFAQIGNRHRKLVGQCARGFVVGSVQNGQ